MSLKRNSLLEQHRDNFNVTETVKAFAKEPIRMFHKVDKNSPLAGQKKQK